MTVRSRFLIVLVLYAALTAILFLPSLPDPSAALLGPPEDNMQDFWNSWYAAQGHAGAFFFTTLIRFPQGVSLIYHSFAYPQVFAVWLLGKLFGTGLPALTALQNLTILASFPLAAAGAFLLCRHIGAGSLGAAAGGFVFAFNPWHVAQAMHHAHVATIEFLPFFVLCYLLALERRRFAWLAAAAGFYALSALSCWYFLFYGLYFIVFHALHTALRTARQGGRQGRWNFTAPALCVAGTMALLSPLLAPMALNGLRDSAYAPGGNIYVADLFAYVAFPPTHLLSHLSGGLYGAFTGNAWEATVYLGLVNLALLAWALWKLRGPTRDKLLYAVTGMIVFLVIASGDALHAGGTVTPLHLPGVILSHLPFFANVRTPARAIVFVYLFLGMAVALAMTALTGRSGGRWVLAAAAVLMLLDFAPAHLATTPTACAPELAVLEKDPGSGFGVLDLPLDYGVQNRAMMQQPCHGRPIATGVVARQLRPTLADRLALGNLAVQRRQLAAAHIKYILLHRPRDAAPGWDRTVRAYERQYEKVLAGPSMTVLRVY